MMTKYRFTTRRVVFLQILFLALLAPTAKCFFGVTLLFSVIGKIDNHNSRHEKKNPSSAGNNAPKIDRIVPSMSGIDANQMAAETHQTPDAPDDIDEEEGLVFEGEFNYQSDIVPMATTAMSSPATDLFDFFSDPKNRDLVIKGGGNPCEKVPLTPELHDEWTSQSKIVKSTPPNGDKERNEEILAVYSEVPIVPGLALRAVSYTGCKIMKEPTSALPYYEFTLLKESYQPVGKKAMTWIFDKVTGNKNKNRARDTNNKDNIEGTTGSCDDCSSIDSNDASRKTCALSRVMLKPFPQDGGCKICYYGHVRLTLSKRFLHMLPLPTKVVQAKVNKSIRKQLESECTRSMQKFTGALSRWNERCASTSTNVW